ncbi:adenosine deaminase [Legionella norrlandica]|uniref:adenosine deaminase n=1 Tax=Legionella norrlandica TaxID=1498499 RepID=A0A0A2T6L3_9GAMM|nr:adenosine deaminase [Legionella norrlandica]KGP63068.1 adenosine deaminase [Legionella norrlandica]
MNITKLISSVSVFFFLSPAFANVDDYFDSIKQDPNALYSFFKIMPKGGELHYHLAGGAYPETMLELAANSNYCLDKNTFMVSKDSSRCNGVNIKEVFNKPDLYSHIIKDWSMKDFIPGKESGHDHFFNGFAKYMPIVFDYRPQLLVEIIQRAAQQKEQYLEIMDVPDNAHSLSFGDLVKNTPSYDQKRTVLLANKDFQNNIKNTVLESDRILAKASQELGCKTHPHTSPCDVKVKLLYYVLREQPVDNVFAQALNAFEAVSQSKGNLIGVNLVQPEDGIISLRDYHKQMLIFEYLHQKYPKVPITLHAGELAPQAVTPENLSNHIRDALLTGHAQRIGHGVDIGYENDAEDTLKYMANNRIPVEINLISNLKILNISGRNHPLNYYLSHKVPVVLSTDDEGVLRTDLTQQYVEAVRRHGLSYQQLKQINRNALTYSFLPGKSIWTNKETAELIPDCRDLDSKNCQSFIAHNEKARLQWNLEKKLITFENNY